MWHVWSGSKFDRNIGVFTVSSAEKCDAFTRTKTARKESLENNIYFDVHVTVHRDKSL